MTLDRRASAELERPIESGDDLVGYLRAGEKPPELWRVGVEHEKIAVRREGGEPVAYDGARGIAALLESIAVEDPRWEPIYEDGRIVALDGPDGGITLEPGAQVELNGKPYRSMRDNCAEFHRHLDFLRKVAEPFDIAWLGVGVHPTRPVAELPRVPRDRYRIMREYLPTRGDLALDMMHATASVQVSFDFASEADLIEKMRCGVACTPLAAALFANSCIRAGVPNGFVSNRIEIWRRTDPDRSGLLPIVWETGFGYERYVEWALDVPMFFIVRDGGYRALHGMPFRDFWQRGFEGERATLADWERHLTTLFPEVRVKRILEVRCADAVPPDLLCSIPALWKGLLYDAAARREALALTESWSPAERDAAFDAVARRRARRRDALRSRPSFGARVGGHRPRRAHAILRRAGTPGGDRLPRAARRIASRGGEAPGKKALASLATASGRDPSQRFLEAARY